MINEMIAALYERNKSTMPNSNDKSIVFVSKFQFCILLFLYLMILLHILENNIGLIEIKYVKPKTRWGYLPIMLIIYFILNLFTWKTNQILSFISDDENLDKIRKGWIILLICFVIGFLTMIVVAKYNQNNPLSD